jgi:hypothetical protein
MPVEPGVKPSAPPHKRCPWSVKLKLDREDYDMLLLRMELTDNGIRPDLAPLPVFAVVDLLDEIDLRIVKDLVTVRRRDARLGLL